MIPYGRQDISEADIESVISVLRSDFLTQGPVVPKFEQAVLEYCGAKYSVAVSSATAALHLSCLALGLGPDDWCWTSPNTFVASANCALYTGAKVDFVDIDPVTYNLCPNKLEQKLWRAEKDGKLPKIVIPVHFAGQSCDMSSIYQLSQKYGFKIIEDASHAIGASHDNTKVGACKYSDITVFSFHPVKIITTGEGGLALTNDELLASRIRRLRSHGITNDKSQMLKRPNAEIWNYQQIELGFNYRMTDIHAALGLSQLKRLDDYVAKRHEIARRYDLALKSLPIALPNQKPSNYTSYHLYPIRVVEGRCKRTQKQIYNYLWEQGIAANLHYIPVHRQPYYESRGFKVGDFPEAERAHKELITLPIFPILSLVDHDAVIDALRISLESR
jgi:UDP-4-amino-4,6-dideoxy-N-acetyl-beta-L-altrosamine transaminase